MADAYKSITGLCDIPATPEPPIAQSRWSNPTAAAQPCVLCTKTFDAMSGQGHLIRGSWICNACLIGKLQVDPGTTKKTDEIFAGSLIFGIGAAVVGMAVYATVTALTHFYIGYVAFGVAWLIAKAMMLASDGKGGMKYHVAAMSLTYLAISLADVPLLIHKQLQIAGDNIDWGRFTLYLIPRGLFAPFYRLQLGGMHVIGLFVLLGALSVAFQGTLSQKPKNLDKLTIH